MIRAYDSVYLEKARTVLARMLDFATHDLGYDLDSFFDLFIGSGLAERFGRGDFLLLAGKSGVELAYEVLEQSGISVERKNPAYPVNRSEEYWTGWALAYYQWETSLSFSEILRYIKIEDIRVMYSPYHEMDIRHFVDRMNELYRAAKRDTNLKLMRKRAGLSQMELAELSDIPLRTLQQYEQRRKNINKAQAEYLIRLSRTLNCDAEDLIEKVPEEGSGSTQSWPVCGI